MFIQFERRLTDWFDANGYETMIEDGEWKVQIGEESLSISQMAYAVAEEQRKSANT